MNQTTQPQNKLANSQSPYLLQHASNPVNWYPWGEEAFKKAKTENKPIILSIGYSTCHWCHVMAHESFEDESVASLMNEHYINIKVDREEMPEVDHLYMSVCQAMTGRGGWPLTIVMTPEKEPFFAGTYFPKDGKGKRPGMMQILPSLANAWTHKQKDIRNSITKIKNYLIEANTSTQGDEWTKSMVQDAFGQYASRFDPEFGGFGQPPKFPSAHNLIFLLRYSKFFNEPTGSSMVQSTLQNMRLGGIFDQIGLGFHRYSTDRMWFLPHFEKMLYDQALNAMAYLEAYQFFKDEEYADVVRDIFTYVLRDMTDKKGAFYSAEDADSDGEEGIFYIWSIEEMVDIFGPEKGEIISAIFGFADFGNYHDEATGETTGKNIPFFPKRLSAIADDLDMKTTEVESLITEARETLYKERKKRNHPLKDDKILTDWNGLMIAALALGGRILNEPSYIEAAEKATKFIWKNLRNKKGKLLKRSRLDTAGLQSHLDDYAFMSWGLLNLYEATFNPGYLKKAKTLTDIMIRDFQDKNGGFFIGSVEAEELMVRSKDSFDGAIPSGNSVAAMNLFRLNKMTGNARYAKLAENTLRAFTTNASGAPTGFAHMLTAYMFNEMNPKEIVIVGDSESDKTKNALLKLKKTYLPNSVTLFKDINDNSLEKVAPWVENKEMIRGEPTIYVCENYSCKQPTSDIESALNYLDE